MVSIRPKTFVFGIGNLDILKSVVNLRYVNRQPKTSEARMRGGYCEAVGGCPPLLGALAGVRGRSPRENFGLFEVSNSILPLE